MAKFNARGIEGLTLSYEEFTQIPDEIVEEMLEAGSKVVVEAHKAKIRELGLISEAERPIHLVDSIKAFHKAGGAQNGWQRYVLVYPAGKHGTRKRRLVTKEYKRSKHGRTYTYGGDVKDVTNSEVGFIQEYGAPKKGIRAKQWMRLANEECAKAMVDAEFEVYDRWLKSKNL